MKLCLTVKAATLFTSKKGMLSSQYGQKEMTHWSFAPPFPSFWQLWAPKVLPCNRWNTCKKPRFCLIQQVGETFRELANPPSRFSRKPCMKSCSTDLLQVYFENPHTHPSASTSDQLWILKQLQVECGSTWTKRTQVERNHTRGFFNW